MNVYELIQKLSKYPPDKAVRLGVYNIHPDGHSTDVEIGHVEQNNKFVQIQARSTVFFELHEDILHEVIRIYLREGKVKAYQALMKMYVCQPLEAENTLTEIIYKYNNNEIDCLPNDIRLMYPCKEMKIFTVAPTAFDVYGDWLLEEEAKAFIDGGYTHILCENAIYKAHIAKNDSMLVSIDKCVYQFKAGNNEKTQ